MAGQQALMATSGSRFSLGSRVTVTGKKGVVKFIGPAEFAAGEWIGVELDIDEGKNNGSVNGVQYFDCREGHGLFVKKAQVRLDRNAASLTTASETLDAKPSSSAVPAGTGRASSRLQAIREKNKALKENLAAGKASPQRRTYSTSSGGSRSLDGDSGHDEPNIPGSPESLVSIGSVGNELRSVTQALSRYGHDVQASSPSPASATRLASEGRACKTLVGEGATTPTLSAARAARATRISSIRRQTDAKRVEQMGSDESFPAAQKPPPPTRPMDETNTDMEMAALRAKAADAARDAEEANARLTEVITKLAASEACCRELEGKLSLLRKKSETALGEERLKASTLAKEKAAAAAAGRREADMESQVSELTDACEALTLDKEQLALENEDLQEKLDELQVELDSTKLNLEHALLSAKENEAAARALSDAGGDGRVDVKMLAEQNVQLKEALKRLHRHSIAEKTDQLKAIRSLEKEVISVATLREEVEKLRSWKAGKTAEIEDLMEKLDESKAYEEMVESLTTKNLEIGERCAELEATVADLESSVELSEELESQQAEDIRELQGEIAQGEVSLHNQKLALESVVQELQDAKQTIDRFRQYVDQLKASRDELAAASKTGVGSSALTTMEKRALLTQKASIEKMAAAARRAKMSGRLLQVDLLDARARSSRISMLLPGSLVLAETELRCIEADLSVCRLVRKAGIALELLELPVMDFMDLFAMTPATASGVEGDAQAADTTLDRATAMEDCSRLALEAEHSLPIARTVGEALAVLSTTVMDSGRMTPSQMVASVSSEVASAVVEAEELMDDLLKVIQDEGALRPARTAPTLSALEEATKSISIGRVAAVASVDNAVDGDSQRRDYDGEGICAAVTALQDCLVGARHAILAVTSAALRGTDDARVSRVLLSQREDGNSMLWQSARGLWSDLMALRNVAHNGGGILSFKLEQLAVGSKGLFAKVSTYAIQKGASTALELAEQAASFRLAVKELLHSSSISSGPQDEEHSSIWCPRAVWHAVAPSLVFDPNRISGDSVGLRSSIPALCVSRAERVRASLEEAIDLKPELEAARTRAADLVADLASKSKELMAATSKREQLETLLDKAEGSRVNSTDLQKQVLLLQETSTKLEQENKFMAEALEDLQDSTSRLEAENRTLKMGASLVGYGGASGGSTGKRAHATGTRSVPTTTKNAGRDGSSTAIVGNSATPEGFAAVGDTRANEELASALNWSRAEVARWRGRAFTSALSDLRPLPHLTSAQGGRPQSSTRAEESDATIAGASLRELLTLSKKLAAAREPPRVIGVKSATRTEMASGSSAHTLDGGEATLSSAKSAWQEQQILNARLQRDWKEGQLRAAKALTTLTGRGLCVFGDEAKHQGAAVRVARLRLPFSSTQQVVPVTLGRTSLISLTQALAV